MAVMLYNVKFEGPCLGASTLVLLLAVKPSLIPFVLKVALVSGVFVLVGLTVWRPCCSALDDEELEPTVRTV